MERRKFILACDSMGSALVGHMLNKIRVSDDVIVIPSSDLDEKRDLYDNSYLRPDPFLLNIPELSDMPKYIPGGKEISGPPTLRPRNKKRAKMTKQSRRKNRKR